MIGIELATDAIAAALASIPALAAAMTVSTPGGPVCRINAFHYLMGDEQTLVKAVYEMPAPSLLVAWEGTRGGNFDGATIWKHRWGVYYRMGNAAGIVDPVGYERLWYLTCNALPGGSPVNIRYMQLYDGLDIMDTPSVEHMLDEDQIDRFKGSFVIPEIGDN
jgi:hypothetical protein